MGDLEYALKYLSQAKAIFEKIGVTSQAEMLDKWIKDISPAKSAEPGAYGNGSKR